MESFISSKCSSAAYYLRCISHIRKYSDTVSTKILIHAFDTLRLDYANGLSISASKSSIARLQAIQNRAARLVARSHFKDHVKPIRKKLHWLHIDCRIKFKIRLICFNCAHKKAPSYLCDLIRFIDYTRCLRSRDK